MPGYHEYEHGNYIGVSWELQSDIPADRRSTRSVSTLQTGLCILQLSARAHDPNNNSPDTGYFADNNTAINVNLESGLENQYKYFYFCDSLSCGGTVQDNSKIP